VHLLTVEALQLYLTRLSPRGILALHVSNQNVDLPPVLESNLAAIDGVAGVYAEGEQVAGAFASQVILIGRDPALLEPALVWHKARALSAPRVRAWTDDYSDILSAVLRRYRAKFGATP
jgi:hypothetical protein